MAKFFDYFPVIPYNISGKQLSNYQAVRNIFFRLRVIRSVLSNVSAYYEYILKDFDTPENIAERVYRDAEAHWIILMANDIVDAAYDWPLNYDEFFKYMANKYRYDAAQDLSISTDVITDQQVVAWTQTNFHHYEKVIQRTESFSGLTTETRFKINEEPYTDTYYYSYTNTNVQLILSDESDTFYVGDAVSIGPSFSANITSYEDSNGYISLFNTNQDPTYFIKSQTVISTNSITANITTANISVVISPTSSLIDPTIPYYSYEDLAETQYVQTFNMGYASKNSTNTLVNAGRTVYQVSFRDRVSLYDYENDLNEKKRVIKIIKPEYYSQIIEEFNKLTKNVNSPYLRRLIV